MPARCVLLTITPEQAVSILLNSNSHNRPLSACRVQDLKARLLRGEWKLNGETIIFAHDGTLMDGQHRLKACAVSGVAIETYVTFGQDPEAFITLDSGKGRSSSDDLAMSGWQNTTAVAATARLVMAYTEGVRGQRVCSGNDYSRGQVLAFAQANPGLQESTNAIRKLLKEIPVAGRILAACHFLFGQRSETDRDAFFKKLATGAEMEEDDPILAARRRLFTERNRAKNTLSTHSAMNAFSAFYVLIKAWNASRTGEKFGMHIRITPSAVGGDKEHKAVLLPEVI